MVNVQTSLSSKSTHRKERPRLGHRVDGCVCETEIVGDEGSLAVLLPDLRAELVLSPQGASSRGEGLAPSRAELSWEARAGFGLPALGG